MDNFPGSQDIRRCDVSWPGPVGQIQAGEGGGAGRVCQAEGLEAAGTGTRKHSNPWTESRAQGI